MPAGERNELLGRRSGREELLPERERDDLIIARVHHELGHRDAVDALQAFEALTSKELDRQPRVARRTHVRHRGIRALEDQSRGLVVRSQVRRDTGAERMAIDDDVRGLDPAGVHHPVVDRLGIAVEGLLVERSVVTGAVAPVVERDDPDAFGDQRARPILPHLERDVSGIAVTDEHPEPERGRAVGRRDHPGAEFDRITRHHARGDHLKIGRRLHHRPATVFVGVIHERGLVDLRIDHRREVPADGDHKRNAEEPALAGTRLDVANRAAHVRHCAQRRRGERDVTSAPSGSPPRCPACPPRRCRRSCRSCRARPRGSSPARRTLPRRCPFGRRSA